MACIICGNKAGLLDKSALRGKVCKKCCAYIPDTCLKTSETEYLKEIYQKNKEKADIFECTASYGHLYIDQTHNMLCVSEKGSRDGPAEFSVVLYIRELEEIGLYLCDAKNTGQNSNRITGNIKLMLKTKELHKEFVIARNKDCPFKVNGNKISYDEPREVSMFRSMLNQMIENESLAMIKKLERLHMLEQELKRFDEDENWAKGVLFIDKNQEIDADMLKARRNKLIRQYHPDFNKESADTDTAAQINKAYKILGGK